MSERNRNLLESRLPRAVVVAAAAGLLLSSCTSSEGTFGQPKHTASSASASPSKSASEAAPTLAEGEQPHATHEATSVPATAKPSSRVSAPEALPSENVSAEPSKSASEKPLPPTVKPETPPKEALQFNVNGACPEAGALTTTSSGFTPGGLTQHTITAPNGLPYIKLINGGIGSVDAAGHPSWSWPCEPGDPQGVYTGQIRDAGPDRILNTADDRTIGYSFKGN